MKPKIIYSLFGVLIASNLYLIYAVSEVEAQARHASFYGMNANTSAQNVSNRINPQLQQIHLKQLEIQSSLQMSRLASAGRIPAEYQSYSNNYHEILLEDIALKMGVDLNKTRAETKRISRSQYGRNQPTGWIWVREPAKAARSR